MAIIDVCISVGFAQAEGCAVSKAMLDDIAAQEAACKASLQHAQTKLQRLNSDAEIAKQQATLDELQRKASSLRQVMLTTYTLLWWDKKSCCMRCT